MRPHHSRLVTVVAVAGALAAAGCGSTTDEATPTTPVTTTAPSTTAPTTTTTTEPTTTTTSVEDAALAVHTRFMTEVHNFDSRVDGYGPFLEAVRETTTGDQLRRMEELVASDEANGIFGVGPGYDSNVVSVEINDTGDHATVIDCSLDQNDGYDADDNLVYPAATAYKLRRTELTLLDGRWMVEDFITGGDQRCNPEDHR